MPQDFSENILKEFHLDGNVQSKSNKDFGLKMAQYIVSTITAPSSYYFSRNQRFKINRDYAAGRMNAKTMFADLLKMNGKDNYVNLIWDAIKVVDTVVSRLVGRWMTKENKIRCTAIDDKSAQQKTDLKENAEFNLDNKELLAQLEQSSGVPQTSKEDFVPEDKDELDIWIRDFLRLPEEILYQLGINHVFDANGFPVLLRRWYEDSAIVGLIGGETYMDTDGTICVKYHKSENLIYSYSEYPDFRDTSWRGIIESWKISDVRAAYPDLPEQDLFKIAQKAKQYQYPDKLLWQNEWTYTFMRPYDDWNVDVVTYYLKTVDTQNRLYKVGSDGKLYIDKLQKQPDVLYGRNQYEKPVWNMYKGVYVKDADILLEWGVQNNLIRPQNPKESGDVEFPIKLYMYHNRDMRNIAVPEKIEEPVKMMMLTRLKIQQLIAKMSPPGNMYNVRAMRELDLGTSTLFKPLDLQILTLHSGDIYYTDLDAEGNPIPNPVTPNPNNKESAQLSELVNIYNYHQQVLRDELGINELAEGQTVKPRTTNQGVQTSLDISFNATDYMRDAVVSLYEDLASNVACLLHKDVTIGAKKYRDIVGGEESVKGRVFSVKIEDMPSDDEVEYLEALLNDAMKVNPEFILYCDPFKIRRMAREDADLAELYFRQAQKRALKGQMEQAQNNAQANAQQQVASLQAKAQADAQLKEVEGNIDVMKTKAAGEAQNKSAIINMVASILSKGLTVDASIKPLVDATVQNLMIPMVIENEQVRQAVIQQMQAASQQQAQPQQPEEQMQEQEMPQEQMQPQMQ